jgi:DNA mismatch repair protein MutL
MANLEVPNRLNSGANRIRRLPSDLVNQIAAGEVVERPSNLIKELVENSLDAGSTRIEVHLIEGGLKEIAVIDDGCGICEEDLGLAIERHTTSKINALGDLETISTFGFRGEALSSIASVSDFSIRSRPKEAERGMWLHVPYGEKQDLKPVGCPIGTQVLVKDLFSKIPARFKFLRSQATELSHCIKTFKELALGNPEVSFFLQHNGRLLSKYTSPSRAERIQEALKPDWTPVHFQDSNDEMKFEAFLSPLDWTQERGEIILFINQRPVKNRLLLSSIKNSFLEIAGPHHEPSGVFYLDIRGDWVDVNVHPQKLEVRFYRQERIYGWILTALRKQLSQLKDQFPIDSSALSANPIEAPQSFVSPYSTSSVPFHFRGIVGNRFFLIENSEGLFLLNPRALESRFFYLNLKHQWESKNILSKSLPVARILSIAQEHFPELKRNLSMLIQLGFDLELFGDRDVAIKAIPAGLDEAQLEPIFHEGLRALSLLPKANRLEENTLEFIKFLASRLARPEGYSWDNDAITSVLRPLVNFNETWTCPNENPVLFKLSWNQLEQYFKSL